jgi:hypothetical protein
MSYIYEREEITEASLQRVGAHAKDRPIAMLTAFRGRDKDGNIVDLKTNRANNRKLETEIRAAGFGFIKLLGTYEEDDPTAEGGKRKVSEDSFLIIGRTAEPNVIGAIKGFAKKAGQRYFQDSIFFKDPRQKTGTIIGTKEGVWPGMNVEADVGEYHPMRLNGIYSLLVRGKERAVRGFKFEAFEYPRTVMEIWNKKLQDKIRHT